MKGNGSVMEEVSDEDANRPLSSRLPMFATDKISGSGKGGECSLMDGTISVSLLSTSTPESSSWKSSKNELGDSFSNFVLRREVVSPRSLSDTARLSKPPVGGGVRR